MDIAHSFKVAKSIDFVNCDQVVSEIEIFVEIVTETQSFLSQFPSIDSVFDFI